MQNPATPASRGDAASHQRLIEVFFDAFARGDIDALGGCYHPEISFGDPVFPELEGRDRVIGMWRMLVDRTREVEVTVRDVAADHYSGSARWTARYIYAPTGRRVLNQVTAQFRFEDGLIVRHHDDFDLRRWSRMAFGRPAGTVLGLTAVARRRMRRRARGRLEEYLRSNSLISG
ncbi:hypothetical protein Sru01_36420 [Sphaerisporangium rufum]|uniref:SnoaL-like domain-containing protein n=1 Tax=Sphaerisporangium rufum TaxID=1381558 RepID=A0A919V5U0_9ACTN|nr:nuclear transport factor 2 family protein [Sphaerisporangium rufum]GII78660.1 hypothetical protein Sru01_36420 [Sphaerisporangium rufum]